MNRVGPVIIIEDDEDDQEILSEVFLKPGYPNEVAFFSDAETALNYLNNTDITPFLILPDINLPKLDGFALHDKIRIDAALQIKCIPYLFFTTALNQKSVIDAYIKLYKASLLKKHPSGKQKIQSGLSWNTGTFAHRPITLTGISKPLKN